MKTVHLTLFSIFLGCLSLTGIIVAQPIYQKIGLHDKANFINSSPNWKVVGNIWYGPFKSKLREEAGSGVLVNTLSGNNRAPLVTKMEHGNILLEFDFMLAPYSSTTVYLQGRYGIRLTDSWSENSDTSEICGSILKRSSFSGEERKELRSLPPRMNVARAPGLWQHLRIVFQSPQFDPNGEKRSNARLLQVSLNGVFIHEDIALPDITYTELFQNELNTGPLVFSGNSRIAFRNIRYCFFDEQEKDRVLLPAQVPVMGRTPLVVTPVQKTIVQRCFMSDEGSGEDQKMTSCAVVGESTDIHYGINLEQGAVIRLWKGEFIDATTMWEGRGVVQLARPLGSVITLSGQPLFATFRDQYTPWPDTMQQGYRYAGYQLDKQGRPTFNYYFQGLQFHDRIIPSDNNRFLTRSLHLIQGDPGKELWILLAAGTVIEELEGGLYAVNDKSYYVRLDKKKHREVVLRDVNGRKELLVPGSALKMPGLTWSYIW